MLTISRVALLTAAFSLLGLLFSPAMMVLAAYFTVLGGGINLLR